MTANTHSHSSDERTLLGKADRPFTFFEQRNLGSKNAFRDQLFTPEDKE